MSAVNRILAPARHNTDIGGYGSRIAFAALTCPGRRGLGYPSFVFKLSNSPAVRASADGASNPSAPGAASPLLRQRIGADLDVHGARLGALAAFHQPRHAIAAGAPQPAALPAGVGVVDAAVEALGEEAHRVRDAQHHHLAVLEGDETVIEIGGGDRDVLAKADRVVVVDPGVVTRLRAGVLETLETGSRIFVESKAFGAVIAGGIRPVQRVLAFAAVETDQRPVRARAPQHAV